MNLLFYVSSSKSDNVDLIAVIAEQINEMQKTEIFGRTVKDLLSRNKGTRLLVPELLEKMISHLEKNCLEVSGLFRLSGSTLAINQAKGQINRGISIDFATLDDNVVTSLLKQFFREMEDTIIPVKQYQAFVACGQSGALKTSPFFD
jgi:hypothetical protein